MRALLSSVGLVTALAGVCGCDFRPAGSEGFGDDGTPLPPDARAPTTDGRTTDAPPPIDARMIDAPPAFDENTCPPNYVDMGNTPSRYRVINAERWRTVQATCKADSAGLTHLAVLSGNGERDEVGLYLAFTAFDGRRMWLGTWHDGTMARTVTGEPLYPSLNLQSEQAVSWERAIITPFFVEGINARNAALCECDGRASTP